MRLVRIILLRGSTVVDSTNDEEAVARSLGPSNRRRIAPGPSELERVPQIGRDATPEVLPAVPIGV